MEAFEYFWHVVVSLLLTASSLWSSRDWGLNHTWPYRHVSQAQKYGLSYKGNIYSRLTGCVLHVHGCQPCGQMTPGKKKESLLQIAMPTSPRMHEAMSLTPQDPRPL